MKKVKFSQITGSLNFMLSYGCLKTTIILIAAALLIVHSVEHVLADSNEAGLDIDSLNFESDAETGSQTKGANPSAKDKGYVSPRIKTDNVYLIDSFDDENQFKSKWLQSKDPKYQEGKWQINSGPDRPHADLQLLLPFKARHYAIASKLDEQFMFSKDKPLIVQYEVQFREGLDCGGAYVKLLRNSAMSDLSKMSDKTPFTIMFGPDKCGSEAKLHFIIQYLNPKTQEYGEKHWKQAKYVSNLMSTFTDKKHHIYRLVLEPNSNFEIFLDEKSVGKGTLLEDMDPAINPPKEIVDINDVKPTDWDERPLIDDPFAKKPEDWDEDAPKTIDDPNGIKPSDWLENEPKYISDPSATKPADWEEMDGEWEAPLIENPACAKASGCGEWKAPSIPNPNYKGKWKPGKIDNPKYKGKWSPRMIPNSDYFFDENPFSSLEPIGGLAFELWSMADNIAFDNIIITSDKEAANLLQFLTWQDKKAEADATSTSLVTRSLHYLKVYPWLWVIVALAVALPLFFFISYCCDTKRSRSSDSSAKRKKADESRPDDPKAAQKNDGKTKEDEPEDDEPEDDEVEEQNDEEEDELEVEEKEEEGDQVAGDKTSKRQVRQRKKN